MEILPSLNSKGAAYFSCCTNISMDADISPGARILIGARFLPSAEFLLDARFFPSAKFLLDANISVYILGAYILYIFCILIKYAPIILLALMFQVLG